MIHIVDHYVDIIVDPPRLPYRMLNLFELGAVLTTGALTAQQVAHMLAAIQAFVGPYARAGCVPPSTTRRPSTLVPDHATRGVTKASGSDLTTARL